MTGQEVKNQMHDQEIFYNYYPLQSQTFESQMHLEKNKAKWFSEKGWLWGIFTSMLCTKSILHCECGWMLSH